MNHFKIFFETKRPLKVFVENSTASSVKNKKLFERSEFFLFSYEDLNFKKVSEGLTFLFRFCVKTKMKEHQKELQFQFTLKSSKKIKL